jgi:ribose transport system substrate-binding protein
MAHRWLVASSALLGCLVLVGTGAAARSTATRVAASNLPAAQANADDYDSAPPWVKPGPKIDGSAAKGKSIFVIPAYPDAAILPSVGAMVSGIRQAAKVVGVKALSCSNSGSDAGWTACFKAAIGHKVNAIVLAGGLAPSSVSAQLLGDAKSAGIPVIGAHVPDPSDFTGSIASTYTQDEAGLTAIVPAPYEEIGKLLADEVTVDRPTPAGRFVIFGASDLLPNAGLLEAVQTELAAVCGSACPTDTVDLPYASWQTNAISAGNTATLQKQTITFIPLFDKVSALLAQGVHDARNASPIVQQPRIHSYGGTPWVIQLGQDNNRVEGDVAENMNWLGWATMDQTLRVLIGSKPLASEQTGLRFVDDDAWGAEGVGPEGWSFPPILDQGWGDPRGDDGWITGYRTLWGLPGNSDGYQLSGGSGGGDDD